MFLDPSIGKNFFDRHDILSLLRKRVDGFRYGYRQNIAIIGPPYCGKTSVIYRFINNIPFKDVLPVYIEAKPQGFSNFATRFIYALLFQYLNAIEYSIKETDELPSIASDSVPKTVKSIREIEALLKDGNMLKAYAAIFELPAIVYSETNLRPLIIIDEFHRIEDFGIEDAFSVLGRYIMFQKDTMYVVISSNISHAKKILSEKLSLLFGNFEVYELGTFDVSTAIDFINFRLGPKALSNELKNFLVAFTDGHPLYLDCILLKLNERLMPEDNPVDVITNAFTELLFDSKGILNQHFASLVSDLEKIDQRYISILFSISNGNRKIQSILASLHLKAAELRSLLHDLVDFGIVTKCGVFYVIRDKVFEFWLKNVHQSKEYRLDVNYESKISRFSCEIKNYIESFLNASKRSYIQVLEELFCSFNKELIQLDKKRFIFPRFKVVKVEGPQTPGVSYVTLSDDKCIWAFLISQHSITDDCMMDFLSYSRQSKPAVKRRIIISPSEMDANTKLLAKEARAWIWTSKELNELLDVAGRQRIIMSDSSKALSEKMGIKDAIRRETA